MFVSFIQFLFLIKEQILQILGGNSIKNITDHYFKNFLIVKFAIDACKLSFDSYKLQSRGCLMECILAFGCLIGCLMERKYEFH